MSKQLNIPKTLNSSALSNLSKSALTRKGDIAVEVMYVDPDECYVVINPRKKMNVGLVEAYTIEFLDPEQGQRDPCTVYPKDEKGYRIHHGATRTMAGQNAKKIKSDWKLKVIIDPRLTARGDFKNFWEQGTNNINRDNMSIFDQADWLADCIALAEVEGFKLTQTDIARQLVMSKTQVSRILALHKATVEIREVYESGRTTDPETLSNLVKISEANPQLLNELISKTELDRATVREVMKSGKLPSITIEPIHAADAQNIDNKPAKTENSLDYFVAHAQQKPLESIELSSGECFILSLKTDNGYQAAAKTNFAHNFNLTPENNKINIWGEEYAAIKQAQQNIYKWTFELEKHKDEISEEQLTDALSLRDWLESTQHEIPNNSGITNTGSTSNKRSKTKKTIVTLGTWNGQDCVLVTSLASQMIIEMGNIIEEAEAEGLVYIQLGNKEFKKIQPEEFHLKSVKFID